MAEEKMDNKLMTTRQAVIAGVVVFLVVAAMAAISLAAFSAYGAAGAAKVLAVIMPALSAVIGAAIGGGAGVAAGSSGKQAVQNQLTAAKGNLRTAATELDGLKRDLATLHEPIRVRMTSPSGISGFKTEDEAEPIVSFDQLDHVTERLARLDTLLR